MKWYILGIKNYWHYSGRATRKEYWMFYLFNLIIVIILGFIQGLLNISDWLPRIYILLTLIPLISIEIRRLHDIGKSGWWILIHLVPIIGSLIILIFLCFDSQKGENKYGPYPK